MNQDYNFVQSLINKKFGVKSPFLQSKEHDPKCEYIKTWIPELKDVPNEDIHNWDTAWEKHKDCGYPKPIIDYKEQREKSIKMYKDALY